MTRMDMQIAGYLTSSAIVVGVGVLLILAGAFASAPVWSPLAFILGGLFLTAGTKLYLRAF